MITLSDTKPVLTKREFEVLYHVAMGNTNKEIAAKLKITYHTIEIHRERAFHKLNIHTAVNAARWMIKYKFISVDFWLANLTSLPPQERVPYYYQIESPQTPFGESPL